MADVRNSDAEREELVAYLDGELDAESSRIIEDRLAADENYRRELQELERSWDLLDTLPKSDVDSDFTKTTLEMVAVKATEDVEEELATVNKGRLWKRGIAIALSFLAGAVGFAGFSRYLERDNEKLMEDIAIIERVDVYRHIDDVEFLLSLSDETLFGEETLDEE